MRLTQLLNKGVLERPQATATVCGTRRRSFAELGDRVARLAGALQALGLPAGGRVGLLALNADRTLEVLWGTWWAGGVVNPVNVRWTPQEVAYSLDDCDTRILLVDDAFKGMADQLRALSRSLHTLVYAGDGATPEGMLSYEELLAQASPVADAGRQGDDLAGVLYTGGTTGKPKGVMLSHTNLVINALSGVAAASRPDEAVGIVTAPLFHVGGISLVIQLMLRQCKQVILPGFDEIAILNAVRDEGGSEVFMVPTMLKRLIEHPRFGEYDVSGLKLMIYGAAPIDGALLAQATKALPATQFTQAYGMTETAPTVAMLPAWCHTTPGHEAKLRSVGRPVPIAEIRIVDPEGRPVPTGQAGEVIVRGPMVMQGYWGKPEQTAQALKDGWMHTGDGGRFDEDGFLYITDRIKDMIVTGGENVYSVEVENVVAQLPGVSMVGVIGLPDDQWGERVHAVVVLREGHTLTAEQVMAHCKGQIAGYKCPRSVEFRAEMPLSAAGKLLKHVLRAPYWEGKGRSV